MDRRLGGGACAERPTTIEWGCWAPFFPRNGLSYTMPLRCNNLDIEDFVVIKRPFVFNNRTYTDIPFSTKFQCRHQSCTCQGTCLLQTAPLLSTRLASTNIHQASSFMIHPGSIQITHHHATLSFWFFFKPPRPDPTGCFLTKCPCCFSMPRFGPYVLLQNAHLILIGSDELIMSWYKKPLRFSITSSHVFFRMKVTNLK